MDENIDKLVDVLFARDADFLRRIVRKRRKHGMTVALIGIVIMLSPLIAFVVVPQIVSLPISSIMNPSYVFLIIVVTYFIGLRMIQYGIVVRREATNILNPGAGRYTFFSRLECPKCGFEYIRERKPEEFVGGVVEEKCQKCNEPMRIIGIFAKSERKLESIGYPLLPVPGQSIISSIKASIMNKLSPFKIALRSKEKEDEEN